MFNQKVPVKQIAIEATVIRANGKREERGVIAFWHRNPCVRAARALSQRVAWTIQIARALGGLHNLLFLATVFANAGKAIVTNRIKGAGTEPNYVAWGTGAGTAAVTDTTLFTESAEARTAGTSTQQTTTVTNDTYQVVGTITATAGRTITNVGVFDAATVGNLLVKGDFTGIALLTGDSIQFTIKLQFT